MPCVFIRLSGCNLNCQYCDTEYAKNVGDRLSIAEIMHKIAQYDCELVEITGGEPLLQQELYDLIGQLRSKKYKLLIETNGSKSIAQLPHDVIKIVDWKTPGSGEADSFNEDNLNYLTKKDEIKFVISGKDDYLWSKDKILRYELDQQSKILMSVVNGKMDPADLCDLILADKLNVRFQLQLHKYIWPEDEKGR